jgi:hypothetical protein
MLSAGQPNQNPRYFIVSGTRLPTRLGLPEARSIGARLRPTWRIEGVDRPMGGIRFGQETSDPDDLQPFSAALSRALPAAEGLRQL